MLKSVLFACNMNSVRSPMAACLFPALVAQAITCDSAGLYRGWRDPMTETVLNEIDVVMEGQGVKTLSDVDFFDFDLIIALTPEVAGEIRRLAPGQPIEYWDVENPSTEGGGYDHALAAYRTVRDDIAARIEARFCENRHSA